MPARSAVPVGATGAIARLLPSQNPPASPLPRRLTRGRRPMRRAQGANSQPNHLAGLLRLAARSATGAPQRTLMALVLYLDLRRTEDDPWRYAVWPCNDTLASQTGSSTRTIQRHLQALETAGLIRRRFEEGPAGWRIAIDLAPLIARTNARPDNHSNADDARPSPPSGWRRWRPPTPAQAELPLSCPHDTPVTLNDPEEHKGLSEGLQQMVATAHRVLDSCPEILPGSNPTPESTLRSAADAIAPGAGARARQQLGQIARRHGIGIALAVAAIVLLDPGRRGSRPAYLGWLAMQLALPGVRPCRVLRFRLDRAAGGHSALAASRSPRSPQTETRRSPLASCDNAAPTAPTAPANAPPAAVASFRAAAAALLGPPFVRCWFAQAQLELDGATMVLGVSAFAADHLRQYHARDLQTAARRAGLGGVKIVCRDPAAMERRP